MSWLFISLVVFVGLGFTAFLLIAQFLIMDHFLTKAREKQEQQEENKAKKWAVVGLAAAIPIILEFSRNRQKQITNKEEE